MLNVVNLNEEQAGVGSSAIRNRSRQYLTGRHVCVGDCAETLAKAADMGATTIVPARDEPNVGRFGVIADPTGAVIAVIKLIEYG